MEDVSHTNPLPFPSVWSTHLHIHHIGVLDQQHDPWWAWTYVGECDVALTQTTLHISETQQMMNLMTHRKC